ncbi:hypothetical protein CCT19_24645 [Escherichia coli]|nr:hypothetical protein [Escherichia coli]
MYHIFRHLIVTSFPKERPSQKVRERSLYLILSEIAPVTTCLSPFTFVNVNEKTRSMMRNCNHISGVACIFAGKRISIILMD